MPRLIAVQEIENLDTLTGLEELWLGKNKITELKVCRLAQIQVFQPHKPAEHIAS